MKPAAKFRGPGPSGERGATMVLVALAMVAIIAMAAMSIDLVTLYLAREEAQRSADAAALAAAHVISDSGITGTADPDTDTSYWKLICGPSGLATQTAQAIGGQNAVGNQAATVSVTYSTGGSGQSDCSPLARGFAVNPLVTVKVQRLALPTFFSRIWGIKGNNISATATAEAFNPSESDMETDGGPTGKVTPVQPRCVKPWIVPNVEPGKSGTNCTASGGASCVGGSGKFVDAGVGSGGGGDGKVENPGVSLGGGSGSGVIGETFTLFADCLSGSPCTIPLGNNPAMANVNSGTYNGLPPPTGKNLEYLAALAPTSSPLAVPSCTPAGIGGNADFTPAMTGCDQTTAYQCGIQSSQLSTPNVVDLTENPGGASGDSASAVECLINELSAGPDNGQDILNTSSYPFTITAGTSNLNTALQGSFVTNSNSIVSLPIYDGSTLVPNARNQANVTIVGFLQVFINQVNAADGSLNVTVLNVAGCGSNTSANPPIIGDSPVPVRLVTPP